MKQSAIYEHERLKLAIQEELAEVANVHTEECPSLWKVVQILHAKGYRLEVKAVEIGK